MTPKLMYFPLSTSDTVLFLQLDAIVRTNTEVLFNDSRKASSMPENNQAGQLKSLRLIIV